MTDLPPVPEPLDPEIFDAIRKLQAFCGQNAAAKGFDKNPTKLRELAKEIAETDEDFARYLVGCMHSQAIMLMVDELSEKHNEIRKGHAYDFEYVINGKPEGVPSESADVIIRELHKNDFEKVDTAAVIQNKLGFNSTRPVMHGEAKF